MFNIKGLNVCGFQLFNVQVLFHFSMCEIFAPAGVHPDSQTRDSDVF